MEISWYAELEGGLMSAGMLIMFTFHTGTGYLPVVTAQARNELRGRCIKSKLE